MLSFDERVRPWFTIWIRPRKTFRVLMESEPRYSVFILAILFGIEILLGFTVANFYADRMFLLEVIIFILLWGPLYGLFHWFVYASLLFKIGQWLGGAGTWNDMRATVAWSAIPLFWSMLLWIPYMIILGEGAFSINLPPIGPIATAILIAIWILKRVCILWYFFVLVKGIAEAHEFSSWKALITFALATVGWVFALFLAMFLV